MANAAYHPSQDQLAEYALGALAPGMEMLVSSHLTYCAECREKVERLEAIGGVALSDSPLEELDSPSLENVLDCLDTEADVEVFESSKNSKFPLSLQNLIGKTEDEIDWSFRLPGMYEYELEGFEGEHVSLLKAKPGSKMLSHTHEGEEATLILAGEMADGDRVYRKGDVSFADETSDHKPHIIGNETCICLIVMSGKLKFTGTMGRALNVLMR